MSLSDIFSIPFLICLSLCILLIGCSSIFFYQKISQQDHKITSMIGLISSMAEENQALRLQFGNMPNVGVGLGGLGGGGNKIILQENLPPQNDNIKLISVSDDEDEDDSSSEEEDDDVSSNNEDSENEEDESDNETETHIIKINHDNFNLSTDEYAIFENINQDENVDEIQDEIVDGDSDSESDSDAELDAELDDEINIDENDSSSKVQESNHDIEHLESFEHVVVDNNIKSIHLDLEQLASSADEIKDISIFKSMNDPDASSQQSQKVIDTADFKKMSITKLREIISKQGATDASKLKKNEILKLLGVEQ